MMRCIIPRASAASLPGLTGSQPPGPHLAAAREKRGSTTYIFLPLSEMKRAILRPSDCIGKLASSGDAPHQMITSLFKMSGFQ